MNELIESAKQAIQYLTHIAPMGELETMLVAELRRSIEEAEKERGRITSLIKNQIASCEADLRERGVL